MHELQARAQDRGSRLSQGCVNKVLPTEPLKQQKLSLTFLETGSPRTWCWRGWFLLRGLGEKHSFQSFLPATLMAISGVPWLVETSPQPAFLPTWRSPRVSSPCLPSMRVCLHVHIPLSRRTSDILDWGPSQRPHFTFSISIKTPFPKKVTF